MCDQFFFFDTAHVFLYRFDEMVHWMDHVDSTLRTILREVNTLEEFEKEKAIFQVSVGQFRVSQNSSSRR